MLGANYWQEPAASPRSLSANGRSSVSLYEAWYYAPTSCPADLPLSVRRLGRSLSGGLRSIRRTHAIRTWLTRALRRLEVHRRNGLPQTGLRLSAADQSACPQDAQNLCGKSSPTRVNSKTADHKSNRGQRGRS
jgi:hypothetical protein